MTNKGFTGRHHSEESKSKMADRLKRPICAKGHDTTILGRLSDGSCRDCKKVADLKYKAKPLIKARQDKYNIDYYNSETPEERELHERVIRGNHWRRQKIENKDGSLFTHIDYDRHYQIQQGRCLGCKRHQSELANRLHVDHDHITNKFRALLCKGCNSALGHVKDNIATLTALIGLLNGNK